MWTSLKILLLVNRLSRLGVIDLMASRIKIPTLLKPFLIILRICTRGRWTAKPLAIVDLPIVIENLGPAFVKFGQFLATRGDLVGQDIQTALGRLQDRMAATPEHEVRMRIETILSRPIDDIFLEFGPSVAAASLAQVHFAILPSGQQVAVKILRKHIQKRFEKDLRLLKTIATIAELIIPTCRRLRPRQVVEVLRSWVVEETDLRMEAAAMSHYADALADIPGFVVPEPLWDYCDRELLVTTRMVGVPLTRWDDIEKMDVDHTKIANSLIELFLTTATRGGIFHGDMHPGNIFIREDGMIELLDFGLMGRIDEATSRYLAEILHGFLERDYDRVAQLHFEAGYVPAHQSQSAFAQSLRSVGEPIFGRSSSEISMGRVLQQLFSITEQYGMETQPQLILLQKTMMTIEGVARSLSPNTNIWEAARPAIEDWMRRSLGPVGRVRQLITLTEKAGTWLDKELSRQNTYQKKHIPESFYVGLLCGLSLGLLITVIFLYLD